MKAHALLLAFVFSAAAMAQTPAARAGSQSSAAQDPNALSDSPSDVSAIQGVPEDQGDGSLQAQIENALRNEPALSNSHVTVQVTAESINLSGTVGSSKDKQTAERIAQSFDGNRKLNNNLAITGHGHSDMAPDHSAMNNGGTGNTKNPTTGQAGNGTNNPPDVAPQK
jgi:hypothetical protein